MRIFRLQPKYLHRPILKLPPKYPHILTFLLQLPPKYHHILTLPYKIAT
jgi:hypothetical protein